MQQPQAQPPPPPDRRGRRVLILTSLASVLVMGGLVALAVSGQAGSRADPGAPGPTGHTLPTPAPAWEPGCQPDRARPPRLVVDLPPQGLEFGKVKQGPPIEKQVPFKNDGVGVLCLQDPGTHCGCMRVTLKDGRKRYEPGESGAFVVTLVTEGYSGPQHKGFWVVTNEYERPRPTWEIKADISLGFVAVPNTFAFGHGGQVRKGVPATAVVRLQSPKADAPWTVVGVTGAKAPGVETPAFTWEAKPFQDPHLQGFDLTVTHPDPQKDHFAPIVVKTTHAERPELTLNANLAVTLPLGAYPLSVSQGFVQNGVPAQPQTVKLNPRVPNVAFKVLGVRVEPPPGATPGPEGVGFVAEVQTDPKTGQVSIVARYDGTSRKAGLLEAVAVVTTDLPDQQELRIPLKAQLLEPKGR